MYDAQYSEHFNDNSFTFHSLHTCSPVRFFKCIYNWFKMYFEVY